MPRNGVRHLWLHWRRLPNGYTPVTGHPRTFEDDYEIAVLDIYSAIDIFNVIFTHTHKCYWWLATRGYLKWRLKERAVALIDIGGCESSVDNEDRCTKHWVMSVPQWPTWVKDNNSTVLMPPVYVLWSLNMQCYVMYMYKRIQVNGGTEIASD